MKNNNKVEIFAGNNAPDSRLGMLWMDTNGSSSKIKKFNPDGSTETLNPDFPAIPVLPIISTSKTETIPGKVADATMIRDLNVSKYPKIYLNEHAGAFSATAGDTVADMIRIGFTFDNANLKGADLSSQDLDGAKFANANLEDAILSDSSLTYVDFTNAVLVNTYMDGVDLSEAVGLDGDINTALQFINKDPNANALPWRLIWTDGQQYDCDPVTGLFTVYLPE